jgi:hypothetical protein
MSNYDDVLRSADGKNALNFLIFLQVNSDSTGMPTPPEKRPSNFGTFPSLLPPNRM